MAHYILSFTVYTLAMTGLIFFALFIYKKAMGGSIGLKDSKILSVEETMSISPRKTLMIVRAGAERFLIASDVDKTSLIAKLGEKETITTQISQEKIEHFQNIETEPVNLNVIYPAKTTEETTKKEETTEKEEKKPQKTKKVSKTSDKQPVHLEVVTDKNLKVSEIRKTQRERKGKRNVTIDVEETKNRGFSTLREMVHKVNEM